MSLLALPNELHLNIIQTIPQLRDIYNLACTCRRLANLLVPILDEKSRLDVGPVPALQWASLRGHPHLVRRLLGEGHGVNYCNSSTNRPAIYFAISGRRPGTIVPILLAAGANIRFPDLRASDTTLHAAAAAGHEETMRLLLAPGLLDVNAKNKYGETPLYKCATARLLNPEIVRLLLANGADPEISSGIRENPTPLHAAVDNPAASAAEVVGALLAHGANIEAVDDYLQTPLHSAAEGGAAEMVELLLQHGASVAARDQSGKTPLHLAAAKGTNPEICEILLRHGAELTAKDYTGHTPIDGAAIGAAASGPPEAGFEATIRVLLSRGVGTYSSQTLDGQLLLWAVKNGHDDVLRMILDQGVDVNVRDAEGRTPLHWAALFGMVDIVRLLLDRGADGGVMVDGKTALALAAARGEDAVVELLVGEGGKGVLGSGEGDRRRPPPAHGARRGVVMTVDEGDD